MPGRHVATARPASQPVSLPSSLTDGTLTRAGIAAALVTASAAAVAGSTGAFAAVGNADVSHAATNLTAYSPTHGAPASMPTQHAAVTPIAATAPAAAPVVKHTSPAADAAKKAADQAAAEKKAAAAKAADAKKEAQASSSSSSSSSGSAASLGALGDRIVNTASTFKGTPYVWGATGPDSFDCSGFTQYVFKKMGIELPRTAQEQYDAADHISKSQAQPGDLVFMGSPGDIYHVAIYAGNNKIWTAPEPGQSVKLGNMFGDTSFGRMR